MHVCIHVYSHMHVCMDVYKVIPLNKCGKPEAMFLIIAVHKKAIVGEGGWVGEREGGKGAITHQ